MKGNGNKLLDYIRRHLAGIGIGTLTVVMFFTVVKRVSGQENGFDPGGINTSFASDFLGLPDRTSYDLSGDGDDGEEVGSDSGQEDEEEQEEEKEEEKTEEAEEDEDAGEDGEEEKEETHGVEQTEFPQDFQGGQIILPDGVTEEMEPSESSNMAVDSFDSGNENTPAPDSGNQQGGTGTGNLPGENVEKPIPPEGNVPSGDEKPPEGSESKPGENEGGRPGGEGTDKPGGTEGGKPSGGDTEKPDKPKPDKPKPDKPPEEDIKPDKGYSVVIGGEKKEFDSVDDALAWVADNQGTNEDGQYFEGFTEDEDGNLVPSYTGKENFGGTSSGDTVWDYTGESGVFVVPEGSESLELAWISKNENIKMIVIPKTVNNIWTEDGSSFPNLEKFVVSVDNPTYVSVDGILYFRKETGDVELHMVPAAKTEIREWPDRLTAVSSNSFYHSGIQVVELPDTVTDIRSYAFNDSLVGTIILPESVKSIGTAAFYFASPAKGEKAMEHRIVVKAMEPPQITSLTFNGLDYNLKNHLGDPVTEIIVPDSEDDSVYERYLLEWGPALARNYGGEAVLQLLKTEDGAQERYEYFEEDGRSGYRKVGDTPFFQEDAFGSYRKDKEGNMALVKCTSTEAVVDFTKSGVKFVSVAEGAFDGCSSMVAVILPESIRTLPEDVFAKNGKLKAVISYAPNPPAEQTGMPADSVVLVKPDVLDGYQEAWGDQVRKILGTAEAYSVTKDGFVFDTNAARLLDVPANVKSIDIPRDVTSVYEGAFDDCSFLESVSLPEGLQTLPENVFANNGELGVIISYAPNPPAAVIGAPGDCTVLVKQESLAIYQSAWGSQVGRVLPLSGTSSGTVSVTPEGLVLDMDGKRLLSIPENTTSLSIPEGVTSVYPGLLAGNTTLTSVTVPSTIKAGGLETGAFAGCTSLVDVLWETAAALPESCFEGCTNLTEFQVSGSGHSLTGIGKRAFYGCESLETVLQYSYPLNGTYYYSYPSLRNIGEEAFYGCKSMTYAYLHSSVSSVGIGAFKESGLTKMDWYTKAAVPESCFEGCLELTQFSAGGSGHNLTGIGRRAFYGCESLGTVLWSTYSSGGTNYYYYPSLKSIGEEAFAGCTAMTFAYLYRSVNRVDIDAFKGSGIQSLYWCTTARVPESCFEGCTSLETIVWEHWGNEPAKEIAEKAFYGCTGVENISLPYSMTSIGSLALDGRDGNALALTFAAEEPIAWDGPDSLEGFTIYVPDSENDVVYRAYLEAWEGWLGEHPEDILKTEDGAEARIPSLFRSVSGNVPLEDSNIMEILEEGGTEADESVEGEEESDLEEKNPEGTASEEESTGADDSGTDEEEKNGDDY